MKNELLREEYTTEVTGRDLYDLLGANTIRDYDFYIYIDGVEATEDTQADLGSAYFTTGRMVRGNTDAVGATGNGVLTQVYVDSNAGDKGEVVISIINTYLAKADNDYDDRDEAIDFTIWGLDKKSGDIYVKDSASHDVSMPVENEDINVEQYQEGDIVLVTVADGEIQTIADPEVLSEVTLTGFKSGRNGNLTTGGTRYSYNDSATYDTSALTIYTGNGTVNLEDTTYNVYLDQYGYVAGVEEVDAEKQYVFITGVDSDYSNLSNRNYEANAIFLDGTVDVIEIDARDTRDANVDFTVDATNKTWEVNGNKQGPANLAVVNEWYTYTVDRNGVYTLHNVGNQAAVDVYNLGGLRINEENIDIPVGGGKYAFGDSETVYLNASVANVSTVVSGNTAQTITVIDDVESVTTGIRNVDIQVIDVNKDTADDGPAAYYPQQEIFPLWDSNNWLIGVVVVGEDMGVSSDYAYVHTSGINQETYTDSDGNHHWFREVLIDGEIVDLEYVDDSVNVLANSTSKDGKADNTLDQGFWYRVFYNGDGTVRRTESVLKDNAVINSVPTIIGNNIDSTEVYSQSLKASDGDSLEYSNGSLYVIDNGNRNGFSVRPDVKISYINAKAAGNNYDEVVDGLEGVDDLKTALKRVNDNFTGSINVIFENNSAAVIVLHCTAQDPGYNPGGNNSSIRITDVTLSSNNDAQTITQLTGVGTIPAGYKVVVDLVKASKVDEDAVIRTYTYTEPAGGAVSDFLFNSDTFTALKAPLAGSYYVVVTVLDTAGNVIDTEQSNTIYINVP